MAIVKVIEVLAQSNESWEDATREALRIASKSVRNIQNIYIKEMQAVVNNGQIDVFRINAKISFKIEEDELGD